MADGTRPEPLTDADLDAIDADQLAYVRVVPCDHDVCTTRIHRISAWPEIRRLVAALRAEREETGRLREAMERFLDAYEGNGCVWPDYLRDALARLDGGEL